MIIHREAGKHFDFTQQSGSSGIPSYLTTIIESNTNTQTNVAVNYTEITWSNGVPIHVDKYTDSAKSVKVYDIAITWVGGFPTEVVSNNLDDGIITTTTITWSNGAPISVNKV